MNRCIPIITELDVFNNDFLKYNKFINIQDVKLSMVELFKQLGDIGYLSLIALGITIILVALLRYIAKYMVVVVLILISVGSIGLFI